MTILRESTGDVKACDGCGRTEAGPNQPLHIESYSVYDPNVGSAVRHDYCPGCAATRHVGQQVAMIAGWGPSTVAAPAEPEEEPTGRRAKQ